MRILFIIFVSLLLTSCTSDSFEIYSNQRTILRLNKNTGETWLYTDNGWLEVKDASNEFAVGYQKSINLAKWEYNEKHTTYLIENFDKKYFYDNGWHSKQIEKGIYLVKHQYFYLDSLNEKKTRAWIYEVHVNNSHVRRTSTIVDSIYNETDIWQNYEYSDNSYIK